MKMFGNRAIIYIVPVIVAVSSAGLAYWLTPFVRELAVRLGAVDVPADERRMHTDPVPLLGGLAIFLGSWGSVLVGRLISGSVIADAMKQGNLSIRAISALLAGSLVVVLLGIVDDIRPLPARLKLLIQLAAALIVVVLGGIRIELSSDLLGIGPGLLSGWFSYPATVVWILAVTNGLNFIDGLDGLACGIGGLASLTFCLVLFFTGKPVESVLFAGLGGACIGFLPYNVHPAKIFMGDTGATFLGFALGTLSIPAVRSGPEVSFFVPVLALSLPLYDLGFAVVRRIARGGSPFEADSGHIHHRLVRKGFRVPGAACLAWGFTALECILAVVSLWWKGAGGIGLAVLAAFGAYVMQ